MAAKELVIQEARRQNVEGGDLKVARRELQRGSGFEEFLLRQFVLGSV
jgi:hypothetical protein